MYTYNIEQILYNVPVQFHHNNNRHSCLTIVQTRERFIVQNISLGLVSIDRSPFRQRWRRRDDIYIVYVYGKGRCRRAGYRTTLLETTAARRGCCCRAFRVLLWFYCFTLIGTYRSTSLSRKVRAGTLLILFILFFSKSFSNDFS